MPSPLAELLPKDPVAPARWPRRLFHVAAGSSIPLGILYLPDVLMQWTLILGSIALVLFEVARGLMPEANDFAIRHLPFFKPDERTQITGATFLVLGATLALFAFDDDIVVLSLFFLGIGDPLAALVGRWDHRLRIFGKSMVGSFAFLIGATAVGYLVGLHPDVARAWWLVPGAFVAAVTELLPLPVDDNLSIPLAAASAMTLLAMI